MHLGNKTLTTSRNYGRLLLLYRDQHSPMDPESLEKKFLVRAFSKAEVQYVSALQVLYSEERSVKQYFFASSRLN